MPELHDAVREVQEVRALVARADIECAGAVGTATERFAVRMRVGALRHDDARLTWRLRAETCAADAALERRFDRLMVLVDEVVALEIEAEQDPTDHMRQAMARQAAGELAAEVTALEVHLQAVPPRPVLRLVDRVG